MEMSKQDGKKEEAFTIILFPPPVLLSPQDLDSGESEVDEIRLTELTGIV